MQEERMKRLIYIFLLIVIAGCKTSEDGDVVRFNICDVMHIQVLANAEGDVVGYRFYVNGIDSEFVEIIETHGRLDTMAQCTLQVAGWSYAKVTAFDSSGNESLKSKPVVFKVSKTVEF
jgi:hypothetical protein